MYALSRFCQIKNLTKNYLLCVLNHVANESALHNVMAPAAVSSVPFYFLSRILPWTWQEVSKVQTTEKRRDLFGFFDQHSRSVMMVSFCLNFPLSAIQQSRALYLPLASKHPPGKREVNWLVVYFCVVRGFEKRGLPRKFAHFVMSCPIKKRCF